VILEIILISLLLNECLCELTTQARRVGKIDGDLLTFSRGLIYMESDKNGRN
jgi:hypothetical protein